MKPSWPTKKLGEVVDIKIGGTPSRNNSQYWGGNNAWGSISELNGQTIYDTKEHITDLGVSNSNVKPIPVGTTIMSFKLSIGKVATAGIELYTNEAIAGLIPKNNDVENKWLYYSLPTINYDRYISGAAKGKTLNKAILQEVKLPIPPKSDQKKIVERLDAIRKAQELCGAQISKTEELFKSTLRKELSKIKTTEKLKNIVSFKTGKLNSNASIKDGKYPFFTCAEETFRTNTFSFNTECILLAGNNAAGKFPIKCFSGKFDAYQRTYVIETLNKKSTNILYLYYVLGLELENLRRQSIGGTTKFLTLQILEKLEIKYSNINVQQKIVEKLDVVQEYKKLLLKQKSLLQELFDSVLYKSMKGEMD